MALEPTVSIRYGTLDRDYLSTLATTAPDDDGPVWMVNLMSYRDVADYGPYADDPSADVPPSPISGREADDRYAPFGPLAAVGAEIVFVGDVESQLLGDTPTWDRVAVVRYPTRRAFVELEARADFQARHIHKDAGMEETIVIGCRPIATPALPDDAPDWADVPHPPSEDDPYVVVLHVIRFHEDQIDHMTSYQEEAGTVAVPHGVRLAGWFGAEGTIIGDGRSWSQVRFNAFPSKAAFMDVVFDPERLTAQSEHRETAIADTYTLILRPVIDRLRESIDVVS
ncbi:MAG: hypothetical protein ACXWBN_12110 [Acidimicrobiales bacterium]